MKCLSPDVFNPDVFVSLYFTNCCRPPPTLSAPLDVLTYGKVYKTIDSFLVKVADPSSLCLLISLWVYGVKRPVKTVAFFSLDHSVNICMVSTISSKYQGVNDHIGGSSLRVKSPHVG